jgi:leucyl-tRNA synthetase
LKGLALLIYPFMPLLAETLWLTLGYEGEPVATNFWAAPVLPPNTFVPTNLKKLRKEEVELVSGVSA